MRRPPSLNGWLSRVSRFGAPILWMTLGGAAVHWRHTRGQPRPPVEVAAATVRLEARDEGYFAASPDRLPLTAVLWVVDGDTVEVLWGEKPRFLRSFGLNTPERGQPCYDEATARNKVLSGTAVRLAFDDRREDKHGRLLAYVFSEDGRLIDAQLVAEGLATAWKRDGAYRDTLTALEKDARAAGRGCLWSEASVPASPKPRRSSRSRSRKTSPTAGAS